MEKFDILFAPIAEREVVFYVKIAKFLKKKYEIKSAFLTFYSPGDDYIRKRGFKVFSIHEEKENFKELPDEKKILKLQERYNENNVRKLLYHEKLTFNRFDEEKLFEKLLTYQKYFEYVLINNDIKLIAQELGGFIAPLVLFMEAKYLNIKHVFFEPALYKGRLFFNINSMEVNLDADEVEENYEFIEKYLQIYNDQFTVVIPDKDKHHFMDAGIKKLVNNRNLRQLARKIYYKYIMKKDEEYNAIFNHCKRYINMFTKRKLLGNDYSKPDYSEKYIYFPLHVPLDFQLTVREPKFLNQIELLQHVSKLLPYGWSLYTKEHPASIGGYDYFQIKELLKNKNVRLIDPNTNSYELIKNSRYVLTINSKVGAEAIMQNKRVLVLGNPYYIKSDNAIKLDNIDNLTEYLNNGKEKKELDYNFFRKAYTSSFETELYVNKSKNIYVFSEILRKYIKEKN